MNPSLHPTDLSRDEDAAPPDSALAQAGVSPRCHRSPHVTLREVGRVTIARLQTLDDPETVTSRFVAGGVPLPGAVNGCAGRDPSALCQAPGDWLLFSEFLDFRRVAEQIDPIRDPRRTVLVDLSYAYAVFRLSGDAVPWLLQKHCGLDCGGGGHGGAHAARTQLDHVAVMLHYHQPGSSGGPCVTDLIFDRSLARHVWQLLRASAPHASELYEQHGMSK